MIADALIDRNHHCPSNGLDAQIPELAVNESLFNGRYWIRTSDPFRVKEVRYHCANRPHLNSLKHQVSGFFSSWDGTGGHDQVNTVLSAEWLIRRLD